LYQLIDSFRIRPIFNGINFIWILF